MMKGHFFIDTLSLNLDEIRYLIKMKDVLTCWTPTTVVQRNSSLLFGILINVFSFFVIYYIVYNYKFYYF